MSGATVAIDAGFNAFRPDGAAAPPGIPSKPLAFDPTNHVIFKGDKVLVSNGRKLFLIRYQIEALQLSGHLLDHAGDRRIYCNA